VQRRQPLVVLDVDVYVVAQRREQLLEDLRISYKCGRVQDGPLLVVEQVDVLGVELQLFAHVGHVPVEDALQERGLK
jgi:hypothetical protein